ncbi:MAG: hypothetical protein ACPGYV_14950 [Phycisphaeraceae bacterium]
MPTHCLVSGCEQPITRPGHTLCYPHWKAQQRGNVKTCPACDARHLGDLCPNCDDNPADTLGRATLTATKLGESLGVSSRKLNLILAELGWIEKYTKGWTPTRQGNALGGPPRPGLATTGRLMVSDTFRSPRITVVQKEI